MKNLRNMIFVTLLLTLSCGKETPEKIIWEEVNSNTKLQFRDVQMWDDSVAYAVGGDNWNQGIASQTNDGGRTWRTDFVADKQLRGIAFDEKGVAYAGGIDGYLLYKKTKNDAWFFYRQQHWESITDLAYFDARHGVAVGGIGYQNGVIMPILGKEFTKIGYQLLLNELASVCFSDANTMHAVGYGIVTRSKDNGATWQQRNIDGDFFRSVHFPTASVGYAVGSSGTIIKTTDGGENWSKLRDGSSHFVSTEPFKAVFFTSEKNGYIVGDKGLFWYTENGGDDWEQVENFPSDVDFAGICLRPNGAGIIVGSKGRIFRFHE